jgi:murein DD-endopeptidase MepM/ murein hydrolase activator NlpD
MKKLLILFILYPSVVWGFSMETAMEWQALRSSLRQEYEYSIPPELDEMKAKNYPSLCPVKGYITSGFGRRRPPIKRASTNHKGIDIGTGHHHSPIIAPGGGVVVFVGVKGGYGKTIVIQHWNKGGESVHTQYGHLHKIYVKVGDKVKRRDVIGTVGTTGISTGIHLDYIIRVNGRAVNPLDWMLRDEVPPYKYEI